MPPKKESADKPPKAPAATTQVTVNSLLEDTSTSQAATHKVRFATCSVASSHITATRSQKTHVWVKLAELVGDEGSYIRIPLDTPSFGSDIIRAVPGLSPSDFMKTKLHLVSRTCTPTSATERAALRQPPFASTNPVGTDCDGYFFLVTPPKAEGVYA